MSSEKVATMPQANPVMAPPPPPPLPPTSTKKKTSPPASSSSSPSSSSSTSPSVSPSSSSGAVPTKATPAAANPQLPPLVPVYTKPAILGLPPTAVLTKQEMDFRANLLNPNNDLFWTARGLIRPPVLADALAQGHAILKYEGHLTQKQGGRRLSAQYGRSGAASGGAAGMPLSFGAAVVTPTSVTSAVQGSWRSPAPVQLPTNPGFVTKEDMDIRANQLNPNNDVFWSSRGLIRPAVLADALAQGHAILQQEGHLTQTQTHKTRGRLNSQPSLYSNSDLGARPADTRRSISGQGLPGSGSGGIGSGAGRISGSRAGEGQQQQPMAMRRRASTTGSIMNRPPALDGSVTKDEVDLRANLMNPNNSIFWTSRGLTRPTDLQEALAKGHAVLEAEGHVTHNTGGGRSKSWNRRGSRTELHAPPSVSPLVAAAQRQWSTPFLAPNAGITAMPPTSLSARPGGLPGAAWVAGPPAATGAASTRHPDWQPNAPQRRRYSLPPPGFELFTPPSHFALFRPPIAAQQQKPLQSKQAMPFAVKEGAADSEWDKMDAEALSRPLAPHSAAIPIVKPTAADIAAAKKNESAWVKKAPSADSKKSTGIFLRDKSASSKEEEKTGDDKKKIEAETKAMKQEDKKEATASSDDSTKSDIETRDTVIPSAPTTPATAAATTSTSTSDKVGSLAWQLTQVKLRTRRPSEARESDISTKSATA